MDLLVLIALAVLALPVISIAALVQVSGLRQRLTYLETRLAALDRGLSSLERRLSAGETAATTAVPEPPPAPAPGPVESAPPTAIEPTPPAAVASAPDGAASIPAASVPSAAPAAPTPPSPGFEERFGTRWIVWVGGVAVALGGIFLVRYTIQQGLIGPLVRVALGTLLALALIATGEWARRRENLSGLPGLPTAHIPGILTAAGTVVAYATVYAAYDLYEFLPPAAAFVLLGLVALLTLAAALLHGPALAGLGVLGAFAAPALVSTTEPDYWALYIYVAIVTAAAFTLARIRLWRWLAIAAIVVGALWTVPGVDIYPVAALGAHTFNALAGFALAAMLLVCGLLFGPPAEPGEIDPVSGLSLSVYLAVAALLTLSSQHDPVALTGFVVLTVGTVAIAWRTDAAIGAVPVAAVLASAVMADWAVQMNISKLLAPSGILAPAIPEPQRYDYGSHLLLAAGWAALFGGAGYLAQGRSVRALVSVLWSAAAVFTPLAMLVALYYRLAALDPSLPFAGLALLLAAAFGFATETLLRAAPRPGLASSSAVFATGALAALALALTFALEKGWLTIALALMVPGAAWVAEKRPLPWLRWLAAIMVGVVMARIAYEPRIVGTDLGTTPIFNWLLYGYGVPAASFWLGGWLLRRRADDLPARMVDSGAILFTVLLVIFEIRHYVAGGDIYKPVNEITEAAIDVNAGLALTIGLERVRERTGSIVHNVGALIVAALTLAVIVFNLASVLSPRFMLEPVGGAFFNMILLGYGLPAVLAIVLAMSARTTRPLPYRVVAAITAVTLALFYITLQTRRLFHGPILAGPISDAEQYAYSSAWLGFAVVLLAVGFALRSQPARLLALGVIAITIAKVFIIDTASIAGIYRALSVIGLGIVLLGIGWLYQRLLYPRLPAAQPAAD
jgi:uncharacterized membrane protein